MSGPRSDREIIRQYAQALLLIAMEQDKLDQLSGELDIVLRILEGQPQLQASLEDPEMAAGEIKNQLAQAFGKRISETAENFLFLIIDNKRTSYLQDICWEFLLYAAEAKRQVNPEVSSVVALTALVANREREGNFVEIMEEFAVYMEEASQILDAEVRSVVPLTAQDYSSLEANLAEAMGKKVRLTNIIDPALIGGVVVRIGDTVIDGSIAKRLTLLKESLQRTQFEGSGVM